MALVTTVTRNVFDTALVKEGDLIYVEYENWKDPKRGIVIHVSSDAVTFLYHPNIANVTNRHVLSAEDVAKGGYTVRWTSDMITVNEYPEPQQGSSEPEQEEPEDD